MEDVLGTPGSSSLIPFKKVLRGKWGKNIVSVRKKTIISSYKTLKKDKPDLKYKEMIKELSKMCGIGQLMISKTISEYKHTGCVTSPSKKKTRLIISTKLSEEQETAIRSKIYDFWFQKEIPNGKKILRAVRADATLPDFSESTLYRMLHSMNFQFVPCSGNNALLEKDHIAVWRQEYIEQIKQYRDEGRHIYYLDETYINVEDGRQRLWVSKTVTCSRNAQKKGWSTTMLEPPVKGKRLLIAHIGSSDGFLPGGFLCMELENSSTDWQDVMNGNTFFDYFRNVLPLLKNGSVIVMNNASCHSVPLEVYPTMAWTKSTIIEWLLAKGEIVPPDYVKARLMAVVDKLKLPEKKYVVDEYAKQQDKIVLRIPTNHGQLNPMQWAWATLKSHVKENNTTYKAADVKRLLLEGIESVSSKSWQNFIRHSMQQEDKFQQLDHITDQLLDASISKFVPVTDSETECSTDST